jgi:CRISPR-associated endonuclease Csn1
MTEQYDKTILGIDLGANSIGWSLVGFQDEQPAGIVGMGVRIFEAGSTGSIEQGKDESNTVERRQARQRRRQTKRQSVRMVTLALALQKHGLLPIGDVKSGRTRHELFLQIDNGLRATFKDVGLLPNTSDGTRELPYCLRARALHQPLEPFALGRALYHLALRRGFLSNRKIDSTSIDEETKSDNASDEKLGKQSRAKEGPVKKEIGELRTSILESNAQTLGEYFFRLDPVHEKRIRGHRTARDMYVEEFEKIWAEQQKAHPSLLTPEAMREIRQAIFFQRPLKSQKGLIGSCSLEKDEKRMPLALLLAQEFRMLQRLNDLRLHYKDGSVRPLTEQERTTLFMHLNTTKSATYPHLRSLIDHDRVARFNFEIDDEDKMLGNVTAAKIIQAVSSDAWHDLSSDKQQALVGLLMSSAKEETIYQHAIRPVNLSAGYGLGEAQARRLAKVSLEEGYLALSKKAVNRLIRHMRKGVSFKEAEKTEYGAFQTASDVPLESLPPLLEHINAIRNPVVIRALTELRKIVNAVMAKYGKPDEVHIELVRELKKSKERRMSIYFANKEREKTRVAAEALIAEGGKKQAEEMLKAFLNEDIRKQKTKKTGKKKRDIAPSDKPWTADVLDFGWDNVLGGWPGNPNPTHEDTTKIRLAFECGWICPYSGKQISMATLVGPNPVFEIEHIIPYSVSLDNGFLNVTLCHHDWNSKKGNRTPRQAFGCTADWQDMINRVRRFSGACARMKLERFQSEDLADFSDFAAHKLIDTAYASKLAATYLGMLYGSDAHKANRIFPVPGQVTSIYRGGWNLNRVLSQENKKNRNDHRHHALDAVVIALASPNAVKRVSDAAKRRKETTGSIRGFWKDLPPLNESFLDDIRKHMEAMIVSHRPTRKVSGALHKDDIYGRRTDKSTGLPFFVKREPLSKLKKEDLEEGGRIMDRGVREAVRGFVDSHGGSVEKAFADESVYPLIPSKTGSPTPVKKVRIRLKDKPSVIGLDTPSICHPKPMDEYEEIVVRKKLKKLTTQDLSCVVDPAVRSLLEKHLATHGGDLRKAFFSRKDHPITVSADGVVHQRHTVLLRRKQPVAHTDDYNVRFCVSKENFCLAVYEATDGSWHTELISRLLAHNRRRRGESPVPIMSNRNGQLLFTLRPWDSVQILSRDPSAVYRVVVVSTDVECIKAADGRTDKQRKEQHDRIRLRPSQFQKDQVRKVSVSPIGEVVVAHD